MSEYILVKKSFLIPSIPDKFTDLADAQKAINQLRLCLGDILRSIQLTNLPVYANNTAAINGGLTAGAFYRTGGDPDPVCVVH